MLYVRPEETVHTSEQHLLLPLYALDISYYHKMPIQYVMPESQYCVGSQYTSVVGKTEMLTHGCFPTILVRVELSQS